MINGKTSLALDNLLNSDEGTYAYLFPNRKRLPKIKQHIFTDMSRSILTVDEFVVDKMLDIDYIGWTVKNLLNIDLFPFQIAMLQILWKTPFPMIIGSRGSAKSYTLAVYAILKALLEPGSKVVIIGAGLRQAKLVFGYIESIWNNAPMLRDIVGKGKSSGPRQSVDLCYFKLGTSMITALPMGDGSRIRGFRANTVLCDEFASVPEEIFDIVVRGFTSTAKTPVEEARQLALEKRIAELDLPVDVCKQISSTAKSLKGNQIIYSGTAYYGFNHFARKFDMWRTIIESKGDHKTIANLFGGDYNIPDGFDYRDYSIIRIPYTILPEGMLDKKQLAHAKAVLPTSIFRMEYGACGTENLTVYTNHGIKKIIDVNVGDFVLTHNARYRPVTSKKYRYYTGNMIRLTIGQDTPIEVTPDHLIWDGNNFIKASELSANDSIKVNHNNFVKEYIFDLSEKCDSYRQQFVMGEEFIYPLPSQCVHKEAHAKTKYYKPNQKFKSSVPRKIKASFGLGYILGIYAGDGSLNKANTKQMEIAFNINQEDRANKFAKYIKDIFGIECKYFYRQKDNTLRLIVNSRIICNFIRHMVGHGVTEKRINNINNYTIDMACGFISGYFDSDGHISKYSSSIKSVNQPLLCDAQVLLNMLGCYCCIRTLPKHKCIIRGKEYTTRPVFKLHIPSCYRHKLINIIENKVFDTELAIKINKKEIFEYSGYVYNLEVEQDRSYFGHGCFHHNCFVKDSNGFFPRSLIEQCTVGPHRPIDTADGSVTFTPLAVGERHKKYAMGIDPAAERDNFAISIIEIWPNHRRVVYCWVVNKTEFLKRKKHGFAEDDDYYAYCCSKILELVKYFNPIRIEMDCQGGGYAISEMLRNKKLIDKSKDNFPIYEIIDPKEPRETDGETDGRHILHLVKQSSDYNQNANIALHKSLETKTLLFPAFDTVKMCAALEAEKAVGLIFDTYEEIVLNIEELKNEICTIQMTETATGKERFDTPSVVQPGSLEGRKRTGRLVKDRYTSLLLVNKYAYDLDVRQPTIIDYNDVPGNITRSKDKHAGDLYRGPGVGRMKNSEYFRGGSPFGAVKRGETFK